MALPERQPFNEVVVNAPPMADISTAGSVYQAAPVSGFLVRAYSSISAAITTADCTWTMEVNGTAVTGTGTITQSGSAAGDVDEVIFSNPVWVNKGDVLEWISGGESDTTCITNFTAVLRT
jgi:hypothetical protein